MILWVAVAVGAMFAVVLMHPAGRARFMRAGAAVWRKGTSLVRRARDAIVVYCSKPWTLLGAVLLTLVGQSIVVAGFWLLGRSLRIDAGPVCYFVAFPAGWVIGAIPISPAGLGITEAGTAGLFTWLCPTAPRETVVALVLCQRFIWVLASLPGGVVHLLGAHLPQQEISIDGRESRN